MCQMRSRHSAVHGAGMRRRLENVTVGVDDETSAGSCDPPPGADHMQRRSRPARMAALAPPRRWLKARGMPIRIVVVLLLWAAAALAATVDARSAARSEALRPAGHGGRARPQSGRDARREEAAAAKDLLPPRSRSITRPASTGTRSLPGPRGSSTTSAPSRRRRDRTRVSTTSTRRPGRSSRRRRKPPQYIYGIPFPTIDPQDPQAGVKAVWNTFHAY